MMFLNDAKDVIEVNSTGAESVISNFQLHKLSLLEHNSDIIKSQYGTERESTKDYEGRIIFEFFQNAADRADGTVVIELKEDRLVISNDGIPFTIYEQDTEEKKSDFHSLCTIYDSSKKPGESVGNKGVGFKSVWNISQHVLIESKDEDRAFGFELFSPPTVEKFEDEQIKGFIEAMDSKVPSFYLPKYFQPLDDLNVLLPDGNQLAIATRITVHLKKESIEETREQIKNQISELRSTQLCFLDLLEKKPNPNLKVFTLIDEEQVIQSDERDWLIVDLRNKVNEPKYFELANRLEQVRTSYSHTYGNLPALPNVAVAFPPKNLSLKKSQVYTYLPTNIQFGFNVHVHADFVLDSSRKDVPPSSYNQLLMEIAIELFVDTLLGSPHFYDYPNFHRFLIGEGASKIRLGNNRLHTDMIWQMFRTGDRLKNVLRNVYAPTQKWDVESYIGLFAAMRYSMPDKNETWEKYFNKIKPFMELFCDRQIAIVPIGNDTTFLPYPDSSENYLFYRSEKERVKIQEDLLLGIPDIKVSGFEELSIDFIKKNIVTEYSTLGLLRSLVDVQKRDNSEEVQKRIFALGMFMADNARRDASIFSNFFSTDGRKDERPLSEINVPIIGGGWFPAIRTYTNSVYAKWIDVDYFGQVDLEKCKSILSDLGVVFEKRSMEQILFQMGVWKDTLPLKWFLKGQSFVFDLPWKQVPQVAEMKHIIKNSIHQLQLINSQATAVIEELHRQSWFYLNDTGEFHAPNSIFLFKEHDRRKLHDIVKESHRREFNELYQFFGIYGVQDTFNPTKIIDQLWKMSNCAGLNITVDHRDIYRGLMLALSKIGVPGDLVQGLPILYKYEKVDAYRIDEEIWFVPTESRKISASLDNELRKANFSGEMGKHFVRSLGVMVLEPEIEIVFQDGIKKLDWVSKKYIQDQMLPEFFAIAEARLGTFFSRDEAIEKWEKFRIYHSDAVSMKILQDGLGDSAARLSSKANVFYSSQSEKEHGGSSGTGFIAHDLPVENIVHDINFSKFSPPIAEAIFDSLQLAEVLRSYMERLVLASLNGNIDIAVDFLSQLGISKDDISRERNFIQSRLLSEEEWTLFLEMLSGVLNVGPLEKDNWIDNQWYQNEGLRFHMLERTFSKYPRLLSLLHQISPMEINRDRLKRDKQIFTALYYLSHDRKMELSDEVFSEKLRAAEKELDHFVYKKEDYYDLFSIRHFSIQELEEAICEIKYGLSNLTKLSNTSAPISAPNLFSPGSPSRIGKVDLQAEENKRKGQHESGSRVEQGVIQEFVTNRKKEDDRKLLEKIAEFISSIFVTDDRGNLKEYKIRLAEILDKNTLEEVDLIYLMHVSKNIGDGLGYDVILPEYVNEDIVVLKVEVKSARGSSKRIYFSNPEIKTIVGFRHDPNWRIWFNRIFTPSFSQLVKEQIFRHSEQHSVLAGKSELYMTAEAWYMEIN